MTYTIYPDLMRNLDEDDLYYYRNLLILFTQGVHKVAIDSEGVVIDIYHGIKNNREMIHSWLRLMSYKPSRFETIPVCISGINDEEKKFLALCKSTNGQKKMIVGNLQTLQCSLDCDNCTVVDNVKVQLLDKDDAVNEISIHSNTTSIVNSVLANGNVSNSNNKI